MSLLPLATTSPGATDTSSGGPGSTKSPHRGCLISCLTKATACYRNRRPGSAGHGVVAMPTAAAGDPTDTWWGWGVSWAPVRFKTSAIVSTSWLDRAGGKTPPPLTLAALTASDKTAPQICSEMPSSTNVGKLARSVVERARPNKPLVSLQPLKLIWGCPASEASKLRWEFPTNIRSFDIHTILIFFTYLLVFKCHFESNEEKTLATVYSIPAFKVQ